MSLEPRDHRPGREPPCWLVIRRGQEGVRIPAGAPGALERRVEGQGAGLWPLGATFPREVLCRAARFSGQGRLGAQRWPLTPPGEERAESRELPARPGWPQAHSLTTWGNCTGRHSEPQDQGTGCWLLMATVGVPLGQATSSKHVPPQRLMWSSALRPRPRAQPWLQGGL